MRTSVFVALGILAVAGCASTRDGDLVVVEKAAIESGTHIYNPGVSAIPFRAQGLPGDEAGIPVVLRFIEDSLVAFEAPRAGTHQGDGEAVAEWVVVEHRGDGRTAADSDDERDENTAGRVARPDALGTSGSVGVDLGAGSGLNALPFALVDFGVDILENGQDFREAHAILSAQRHVCK